MSHIAVVGGGQAGFSVVSKLRSIGYEGRITLICEEPEFPYQRPPLSKKYLLGELGRDRLMFRPPSYYSENGIDVLSGQACRRIDADRHTLTVGDSEIHFDKLVLATGSIARNLPASMTGGMQGIYTVRTVANVDEMTPEFAEGKSLLVVGGGYIGLEAASAAMQRGMKVTIVEIAGRILQRVAAPETSEEIGTLHRCHGVELLEGVGLKELSGKERVESAHLTDGREIQVDIVIAGIGIVPATALAETAGLEVENGIRTDLQGRTSLPSIWAAGDCASFPWKNGRIRLESVQNALDQAELVAENLIGAEKDYRPTPWFWSDQYDAKLQIAGIGSGYDSIVTRRAGNSKSVSYWYYGQGKLLAVDAINDPRSYMVGKRLLETGKSADPEIVTNTGMNLKVLLKAR